MKQQYLVPIAMLLLVTAFVIAALYHDGQKTDELNSIASNNQSFLIRDYSPMKGNKNAKVTIVEFFDPACETCKAFHPFVKQLMAAYPGKINLVLRYTPLHHGSDYVVKILESARLQNKFWETLEVAYESQPVWASHGNSKPDKLWMYLSKVGLNLNKAIKDMESPIIADRIRQDMADAQKLQVTKTPGFFVNGKPLVNFGFNQLQALVEMEVNANY